MQLSLSQKVLLISFLVLAVVFIGFEFNRTGDFYIYLTAASNLFTTPNLYHILYGDPAVFSHLGNPFMTLFLYPFTLIPVQVAALLWKVINLFFLYRSWLLISDYFSEYRFTEKQKAIWQALAFVCALFFIYSNLHMLQFTIAMCCT